MAINDLNADPSVFPDTTLNIVRTNIWDPARAQMYETIDSGGYAIIESIKTVKSKQSKFIIWTATSITFFFYVSCGCFWWLLLENNNVSLRLLSRNYIYGCLIIFI